jgi:hypothetical protein
MKFASSVALAATLMAGAVAAAPISQFNKTTNDGVYTLTQSQADALGYGTADYIGFFRVREGSGTVFDSGDTFDATTLANSVTSGLGNIIAFLNGRNGDLGYSGGFFDDLGTTTVGTGNSYYEGVAFLFSNPGNIVFRGTSTFNSGQTRGEFDGVGLDVAPVPVPAALPMLIAGLGGFAALRRKKKAA